MQACWRFYRWDHARYIELRPILRAATTPEGFAACEKFARNASEADILAEIVEAVGSGELPISQARQTLLQEWCCLGVPLAFDRGFPSFVAKMAQERGAEDAAETIGELLTGGKNLEAWLMPAVGLVGFLTPDETARLRQQYAPLAGRGQMRRKAKGKPQRRGGLVGSIVTFIRTLFDMGPNANDLLALLARALNEAEREEQGLAVVLI